MAGFRQLASPSSATTAASSTLLTPDQPQLALRRMSDLSDDMLHSDIDNDGDVFSPRSGTSQLSNSIKSMPPPQILVHGVTVPTPRSKTNSSRNYGVNGGATLAPILVRLPSDVPELPESTIMARAPSGLAIEGVETRAQGGLQALHGGRDSDEETDNVGELTSPSRRAFSLSGEPVTPSRGEFRRASDGVANGHAVNSSSPYARSASRTEPIPHGFRVPALPTSVIGTGATSASTPRTVPPSPSWQGLDATPSTPSSPWAPGWANQRNNYDLSVPSTPESSRHFDPTPQHGIHSRNLSIFFPPPGMAGTQGNVPHTPTSPANSEIPGDTIIPDSDRRVFGGHADWQFGAPGGATLQTPDAKAGKRRGHHHKHSLSHNFFSFLDPTQTAPVPPATPVQVQDDTPPPVPMPFLSAPKSASSTLSPLPPSKRNAHVRLLGSVAIIEAALGAALWVEGQVSGWRCLTAAGYLVFFDALGVGVGMVSRVESEGWRSLRRPYGSERLIALLCFAQSVFLVFAAVYIAKEAVEQVILGSGAHDHTVSTGHSHGEHVAGDARPFPHCLLLLSTTISLLAGAIFDNHAQLVDATGSLFLPAWYMSSPAVASRNVLTNPYTLSVASATAILLLTSFLAPDNTLQGFDSMASLVLTVLTATLAYAPTVSFAQILLQTAPPASSKQMKALRRALRDLDDDRRVLGLGTMRCWAISAGKVSLASIGYPSVPKSRVSSIKSSLVPASQFGFDQSHTSDASGQAIQAATSMPLTISSSSLQPPLPLAHTPLVVTLIVHIHPESSDKDVLDVTRYAWSKLSTAVADRNDGEVTVQVRRGW